MCFLMRRTDTRVAKQCAWSTHHLVATNDTGLSQHKTTRSLRPLSPIQSLSKNQKLFKNNEIFTILRKTQEIVCYDSWESAKCAHKYVLHVRYCSSSLVIQSISCMWKNWNFNPWIPLMTWFDSVSDVIFFNFSSQHLKSVWGSKKTLLGNASS